MSTKLVIFTKNFNSIKAKTRLQKDFDKKLIIKLHNAMLIDTFSSSKDSKLTNLNVYWKEDLEKTKYDNYFKDFKNHLQSGENFTEKFQNLISDHFSNSTDNLLIIGSDCPLIDKRILNQAYDALENNIPVIGPSSRGGFYLLGLTPEYSKINYSKVFKEIEINNLIKEFNNKFQLLEFLPDLDIKEDLITNYGLIKIYQKLGKNIPLNTLKLIEEILE